MADLAPPETIRQAVTVLRCEHAHPIPEPSAPIWTPEPCTTCGTPYEVTTRIADMMPGPPLYKPLADLLDAVVEVWPDGPSRSTDTAASRRRTAAHQIAQQLLGEAA